ncbi:nuclear transport factor 2 family protein [Flavobacterium cerinum]|uniref:SnoaL-like domain-containing protein n=1 Tax=Flavobacterium cerinum TaxID=2502784 RepID=A0A444HB30_9FLAO|nr:nuclear transport factor 2 family protein [Flavobacterium cerinum]RWX00531.1 hypothetical protein EPI11_09665 [Flavobacterium cerinum]
MKRTLTLLALVLSLSTLVSCNDKNKTTTNTDGTTVTVDTDSIRIETAAFMDKFHETIKNKKIEDVKSFIDINGLYCGTDPTEIFSQPSFINYLNLKLNNPAIGTIDYKVDRREMMFDENNQSAVIVDQFNMDVFTQNIPWRMVSRVVKKDNKWIIDFISFSITPDNDVVQAINIAAEKKE